MITQTSKLLVKDEQELDRFIRDIMVPLERDEVYFLALSARNKYLTDEEREHYDLGRTEMFSRQIAYDHEGIYMALARMEASLHCRKTRNGKDIPEKSLVVYINIHPSSTLKAYTAFKAQLDKHYNETFMAVANGKNPNYEPFLRSRTHLMNHIQRSTSRRAWVDIDVDGSASIDEFHNLKVELTLHGVIYRELFTQGGVHVLVHRESLNKAPKSLRLHSLIERLDKVCQQDGGEAKFNKNAMVPLPGTHQAGKLVTFN